MPVSSRPVPFLPESTTKLGKVRHSEAVLDAAPAWFSVQTPPGGGLSAPFEVLRVGRFKHPTFGDVTVTNRDLTKAVENFAKFKAKGAEVPVDYDHSFRASGDSRAAGWIAELTRQGKRLMARVKWTGSAADRIRSNEYRFFSAEFVANYRDETGEPWGFAVLAGALTNRPFLKGMTPVALTEKGPDMINPDLAERETIHAALMAGDESLTYSERLDRFLASAEAEAATSVQSEPADRETLDRRIKELADSEGITYREAFDRITLEEE